MVACNSLYRKLQDFDQKLGVGRYTSGEFSVAGPAHPTCQPACVRSTSTRGSVCRVSNPTSHRQPICCTMRHPTNAAAAACLQPYTLNSWHQQTTCRMPLQPSWGTVQDSAKLPRPSWPAWHYPQRPCRHPTPATHRPVGCLRWCILPLEDLAVSRPCRWWSFLQVQGACTGSSSRPSDCPD